MVLGKLRQSGWLYVVGPVFAFAFAAVFAMRLGDGSGLAIAIYLAAAVGLGACLLLPRHLLLGLALAAFALVPRRLFSDTPLEVFSPAVVIIGIWYVRGLLSELKKLPKDRAPSLGYPVVVQVVVFLLMLWLVFSSVTSISPSNSVSWTIAFFLGTILVMVGPNAAKSISTLQIAWTIVGSALALYALGEFVIQSNPIYDTLYAALGQDPVQHWATYRSSASFGHPLYAGLFFAMTFGLTLGKRLEGRSGWYIVAALLAAAAAGVTGSRSALVALAAAAAVTLGPALLRRGQLGLFTRIAAVVMVVVVAAAVFSLPQVQERLNSDEASDSNATRGTLISLSLRVAGIYNWIGSGANTSAESIRPYNVNFALLESGYLQLLVSVGIPGLVLFVTLVAVSLGVAIKRGRLGSAGMISGYAVAMGFFNMLESSAPSLVLIGFCLLCAWREEPIADAGSAANLEALPATGLILKTRVEDGYVIPR